MPFCLSLLNSQELKPKPKYNNRSKAVSMPVALVSTSCGDGIDASAMLGEAGLFDVWAVLSASGFCWVEAC